MKSELAYETIIGHDIHSAAAWLTKGEAVAIPTETVYGLAANALDDKAVVKIFEAKNRPQFNPLIIHVSSFEAVKQWVEKIPDEAEKLAAACWPGALTLLLEKNERISDLVTAGHSRVAVRVPDHALTLSLLEQLDFPLAAPSANPSGYVSPTTAAHVYEGLRGKIPYILDGGACKVGLESTIAGWDASGELVLFRLGGISKEWIEQVVGREVRMETNITEHPATPGMLKSHYATATPLHAGGITELLNQFADKKAILINYHQLTPNYPTELQFILTLNNDMHEAATNLFSILRAADQQKADIILAEYAPNEGIGRAINDRLYRAQADWK